MTSTLLPATSNRPWWQTAVIYQIYPRSYKDTTGSGVGDLGGVIAKLDYLSETLGIDAIWLSPFYPSPMKDFGYDVADYCNIDPMFGTLADFDELIEQAHRRGLRVIVDWVPNHSSDQHPWFIESRSSRDNPKRDWYVWADPPPLNPPVNGGKLPPSPPEVGGRRGDGGDEGGLPNNWISVFGGSAWEWDENTKQYYLHSFLKEQPDLNWRNPQVQQAMFDTVRFWLKRGVDGFRVDVAHFIMKDPEMRDNPPAQSGLAFHRPHGDYDSLAHENDKGHPDNHKIYRRLRALLDEYSQRSPRMAVGEIHIFDWDEWATYYGTPESGLEFHLPFNFSLLKAPWQADAIRQAVDALEAAIPPWAWPNYVLGNHDEGRITTRYGAAQSRVAAMLLLTLRGTPTLYYGEEIGMSDVEISPEKQLDPFGLSVPGWGRDRCRTPMQWSAETNAGFSPEGGAPPWLPLSADWQQTNAEAQLANPRSTLNFYCRLLAIRKSNPALHQGSYAPLDDMPQGCFVYQRSEADQTFTVALNFAPNPQHLSFTGKGRVVLSTRLDRENQKFVDSLLLRENEGLILHMQNAE